MFEGPTLYCDFSIIYHQQEGSVGFELRYKIQPFDMQVFFSLDITRTPELSESVISGLVDCWTTGWPFSSRKSTLRKCKRVEFRKEMQLAEITI